MSRSRKAFAAVAAVSALSMVGVLAPATASASPAGATYTISVGSIGSFANPDDTPASGYIDKDGTFYYQESDSLYGASQNRSWSFYTGTNFDTATADSTLDNAVNPSNSNDSNSNTTWRCNNSPTGLTATYTTDTASYAEANYCDLVGVWVDPDTGNWYGLVHNEFTPEPFPGGGFSHFDAIDYAESTNQGKTWTILGHAITSPYATTRNDTTAFPNQTWDYGDGDPRLFVDPASGYFYVYYGSRIQDQASGDGSWDGLSHVARAPISGKMATGTWEKWYNGSWSQPGVGGLESNLAPVSSSAPSGYTPVANDYNPTNTGTVDQQIADNELPSMSPLFVMNISYDAYLGLYIGTPQVTNTSTPEPQQFYVTSSLATQQWYLAGDTGSYTSDSWYRWLVDGANATNSTILGKTFRSYCAISCNSSDGEYANITIGSSSPATPPVNTAASYVISNGSGQVLAQVSGSTATTSTATANGSSLQSWNFTSEGDGSYQVTNASTGQALGVASTSTSTRAWGTAPTATAIGSGGPTVGQEWFIVANVSSTGAATGTYRLVNRYSGLELAMSSVSGRLSETTPNRTWTNTTGNSVGGTRTATDQTLTFTQQAASANLNGTYTLQTSGNTLDDPNWSTTAGTQLDTWSVNGGQNQSWTLAQQSNGSYTITNSYSGLCVDDSGNSTTAGTQIIEWTCNGQSNQEWNFTALSGGGYSISSVKSGLLITTASTTVGALVTQQANTSSGLQQWQLN